MSYTIFGDAVSIDYLTDNEFENSINTKMKYLYQKPLMQYFVRNGTDITGINTTPTVIATLDCADLGMKDMNIATWLMCTVSMNTVANDLFFDVRVSTSAGVLIMYLSSGTTTPTLRGIGSYRASAVNFEEQMTAFCINWVEAALPTDDVKFHLEVTAAAGVGTIHLTGTTFQWIIEEYGVYAPSEYSAITGLFPRNTYDWAGTKIWQGGENVVDGNVERHISDKLNWLHYKNYVVSKEASIASYTTLSTTFVQVGIGQFKVELTTFGNDVLIRFSCASYTATVNNRIVYFDFLIDDEYYISSLTATPLTDGVYNFQHNGLGLPRTTYIEILVTDLDEGLHTFEPYFKTSVADSAATVWLNMPVIMMAEEYCLTP